MAFPPSPYPTRLATQPARAGQLTDNSGGISGGDTIAAIDTPALLINAAERVTTRNAIATLAARVNSIELKQTQAGVTA